MCLFRIAAVLPTCPWYCWPCVGCARLGAQGHQQPPDVNGGELPNAGFILGMDAVNGVANKPRPPILSAEGSFILWNAIHQTLSSFHSVAPRKSTACYHLSYPFNTDPTQLPRLLRNNSINDSQSSSSYENCSSISRSSLAQYPTRYSNTMTTELPTLEWKLDPAVQLLVCALVLVYLLALLKNSSRGKKKREAEDFLVRSIPKLVVVEWSCVRHLSLQYPSTMHHHCTRKVFCLLIVTFILLGVTLAIVLIFFTVHFVLSQCHLYTIFFSRVCVCVRAYLPTATVVGL